jgi:hypothetical protein
MRVTRLVLGLLLVASVASAAPITYTHTGFGSGTFGTLTFGDLAPVSFTITASGDTANRAAIDTGAWYIDNDFASITLDGLGTYVFVTPTRYFVNNGTVGFSRAGLNGADLYDGPYGAVGAWDMLSSVGPVGGSTHLMQWSNAPVSTSGGVLVFNNATTEGVFTAIVGDQPPAVPEPASMLLFGSGLALSGIRRLRKRR